jgi:hypothetical protein
VAPRRGYDEPEILSYAIRPFGPTGADGLHQEDLIAILRQELELKNGEISTLRAENKDLADRISRIDVLFGVAKLMVGRDFNSVNDYILTSITFFAPKSGEPRDV